MPRLFIDVVVRQECAKAARIFTSFVQIIPNELLQSAKGFAILTVAKAGFLFSGQQLVVGSSICCADRCTSARSPSRQWSSHSETARWLYVTCLDTLSRLQILRRPFSLVCTIRDRHWRPRSGRPGRSRIVGICHHSQLESSRAKLYEDREYQHVSCYAVVILLHMINIVCSGGNLSVAVGPIGRNAEASGNLNKLAAMYSYSRVSEIRFCI